YPASREPKLSDWAERGRAFRKNLGLDSTDMVVGLIARISPLKGHTLLAEAASLLRDAPVRIKYLVIGEPFLPGDQEYLELFQRQLHDLGLEKDFHFCGYLDPPFEAVAACDLIVNTSISPEGFGLSLVEAMFLERPTLAPAEGGPLEIIEPET